MIACLYLIVNFSNGRNSKFSHKRKKKKKKKKKKYALSINPQKLLLG